MVPDFLKNEIRSLFCHYQIFTPSTFQVPLEMGKLFLSFLPTNKKKGIYLNSSPYTIPFEAGNNRKTQPKQYARHRKKN